MVAPPGGATWGGGNVSLTKCGVECIQRHAQKTLQISVFYAHPICFVLLMFIL